MPRGYGYEPRGRGFESCAAQPLFEIPLLGELLL